MDAAEQLKDDILTGKVDPNRLVDVIAALQRELQAARQREAADQERIAERDQRIAQLQEQIAALQQASGGSPTSGKLEEPFSMRSEEKRQEAGGKKKKKRQRQDKGRRGRVNTADKIKLAKRSENVYPEGIDPSQCEFSHTRPVWRMEDGRAVLVAYHIYRDRAKRHYGKIAGVLGRSEFGLEIVIRLAYLIHTEGLSFDKACRLLNFFENVNLRKSQANALLSQLARHWHRQFEILCTLLANSWVVHADETSWSINSLWAFLSEKARVLFFGVHKDAKTLKEILDPATFAGLMISDDASVYENFTKSQKCWAHLLRKAIKLTLLDPENPDYRKCLDGLLAIYRKACRVQRDGRLSDAGRQKKVEDLNLEIAGLCGPWWDLDNPPAEGLAKDFHLLNSEVMRIMVNGELFPFVTTPPAVQPNGESRPVSGTNNEGERELRPQTQARDTGRTSKTIVGCRRRTIITSVLESLRLYLPTYTLRTVVAEIERWAKTGRSCFEDLLRKLKLKLAEKQASILDRVLPLPSG